MSAQARMRPSNLSPDLLTRIAETIRSIRFGTVQITIHDSRVVQIEKAEKIRLEPRTDLTAGGAFEEVSRADRTTGGSHAEDGR